MQLEVIFALYIACAINIDFQGSEETFSLYDSLEVAASGADS